jgi:hypothetical protein
LIGYDGPSEGTVMIEVEERGGVVPVAAPGEAAGKAAQTFDEALGTLRPTADAFVSQFTRLDQRPDEARLEFGLGVDVEAGAFIAKMGGTANFKITLTWRSSGNDS